MNDITCFSSILNDDCEVHLPIVRGFLAGPVDIPVNIMLDTGSTVNFISKRQVSRFATYYNIDESSWLIEVADNLEINLQSLNTSRDMKAQLLKFRLTKPANNWVEAIVMDDIHPFPRLELDEIITRSYEMNGPFPRSEGSVDILLGVADSLKLLKRKHIFLKKSFALLSTVYGYVPCGSQPVKALTDPNYVPPVPVSSNMTSTEALTKAMEKMWEMDRLPMDDSPTSLTKDELIAVSKIKDTLSFHKGPKRFVTGLLWRAYPDLVSNFASARNRLDSLMRKLRQNPELRQAYREAMEEYIRSRVVERVDDPAAADLSRTDVYYLPHRAVYDVSRVSTKCRIVFDASAKSPNKKSLNDNLVCGPPLQLNILAIELRFRTKRYALIGDIGKMFLQIKVREEDRDYLRFLWKDPEKPGEPEVWRWNSLIFGAADSPFQAITAIKTLVQMKREQGNLSEIEQKVCDVLDNNTYVDDLTIAGDTITEVHAIYEGIVDLLGEANFQVKKWASNSQTLLKKLDPSTLAPTEVDLHSTYENVVSSDTTTLGVQWEPRTDRIHYARCRGGAKDDENTMRSVASLLARPFDPIGLLSPFILQARLIMQECHLLGMKWSDTLPQELQPRWKRWVGQLQYLGNVHFTRYVPLLDDSLIVIFSDASECGYGAVAYCHTFDEKEGRWVTNILCARSRVVPTKKMLTIPKKELAGCLVAVELGQFLHEELKISKDRMRFFCDSEVCLFQLTKNPSYLQPFTANRVEKIQAWGFSFQYVNTCDNPADICSRGCDKLTLNSDFWQHGPKWLSLPEEEWPTPRVDFSKIDRMEGMKKKHIFTFSTLTSLTTPLQHPVNKECTVGNSRHWPTTAELLQIGKKDRISFANYYSEYRMLIKRIAWVFFVLRKWRNCLNCTQSTTPLILPGQIDRSKAEIYWIRISQNDSFENELKCLREGNNISLNSKIIGLSPFLDDMEIMRVGGRLAFSDLEIEQKNPILLAKDHFFTKMLVLDYHERHHHTGIDQTHFGLRERFWILQSQQMTRKLLRTCVKCRRITSQPYSPLMGNLPGGRLSLSQTLSPHGHTWGLTSLGPFS